MPQTYYALLSSGVHQSVARRRCKTTEQWIRTYSTILRIWCNGATVRSIPLVVHNARFAISRVNYTRQCVQIAHACMLIQHVKIAGARGGRTPGIWQRTIPTDVAKLATSITLRALKQVTNWSTMTLASGLILEWGCFAGVDWFARSLSWNEWPTAALATSTSTSLWLSNLGAISRAERLLVATDASSLQFAAYLSVRSCEATKEEGISFVVFQLGVEGYELGAIGVNER